MAFQHRVRRIAIGLALMLFAVCAVFPGLYVYAFLLFVPGLYLLLSGCLDEFPDDEPEEEPHKKPFYARPWFLILMTLVITAAAVGAAYLLVPKPEPASRESVISAVTAAKDPDTWIAQADAPSAETNAGTDSAEGQTEIAQDYVLNTSSKKFHLPGCASVDEIKTENREDVTKTRSAVIDMGYTPCKNCNP